MSVGLLFPAALTALAALALPLLIHLTRRSDRQLLDFAALRWLRAKERARRRLRIDEWPLLVLRLLLLAALVLLLAQPVRFGASSQQAWVVVAPGADPGALASDPALRDASWHWLAPGYPAFDSAVPPAPTATASLLRELDASLAAAQPLVVVVPERLAGLDADRIVLSRRVDWRIVKARTQPGNARTPAAIPRSLAVRYDPAHAEISRYITAAARAWHAGNQASVARASQPALVIDSAGTDTALPANSDWLLWLSSAALPPAIERWLADGGSVLRSGEALARTDDAAEIWHSAATDTWISAQRSGRGRLLVIHGPLDHAQLPELLSPEFPMLLQRWLSAPVRAPDQAMARDVAPTQGIAGWPARSTPLRDVLLWLIAGLWLLERVLATHRRKAARS